MSETISLRKKVILARIGTAVTIALIGIGYMVSNWSGSDSGTVTRTEFMLKNDHSHRNILECLDIAERLDRSGKSDSAKSIEQAVERALKLDSLSASEQLKIYAELARDLQKRGDEHFAFAYAFKTVNALQDLSAKPAKSNASDALAEQLDSLDDAAEILLNSKQNLSKEQMQVVLSVADRESTFLIKQDRNHILDLVVNAASKDSMPLSDQVLRCMFAKDLSLARTGQAAELEKMLKRTGDAVNKFQGAGKLSQAPEPCLLEHLSSLQLALQTSDPSSARKILDLAEETILKVDRTNLDDSRRAVLANCLEKMSEGFIAQDDPQKALSCAKDSVALRPLQDLDSGKCANQLALALLANKQYSEAETVANDAYKFFKAQAKKDKSMFALRGLCAAQYFEILIELQKTTQAVGMMNEELKEQKRQLPASALCVADLNGKLANYYISRLLLRQAAECARRISEVTGSLKGDDKLRLDMMLIGYAAKTKTPELAVEASSNALNYLNKNKGSALQQDWVTGICSGLESLKKAADQDTCNKALDFVRVGFQQLVNSKAADPIALAQVVNDLGSAGEEKMADSLRSEAIEKLPPAKGAVFQTYSIDYVVNGEKETAQYAAPKNSIPVYLDLAHSMQNKDDEQAFKNSFEAIKIMHLLASKDPDLREPFLDDIEDAANVMLQCKKQTLSPDQVKIVNDLSKMELGFIQKTSKAKLLDLAFGAQARGSSAVSKDGLSCMLLRDELLAKRGSVAQLDAQIERTKDASEELQQGGVVFASHLIDLADLLSQHNEQLACRRYLGMAKKVIENLPPDLPTADQTKGKSEEQAKPAPIDPAKLRAHAASQLKLAELWNRASSLYARAADGQNALLCAKKAVALRPMRDAGSAAGVLNLVDRMTELGNYIDAEPLAFEVFNFARAQKPTPDMVNLRVACLKRVFKTEKELHKDELAVSTVKDELAALKSFPNLAVYPLNELDIDLATYYLLHADPKSSDDCLNNIEQSKSLLRGEQEAKWENSGLQRDLINLAVRINDARLAGQAVQELVSYKNVDKAASLKTPKQWWSLSLSCFKKAGDQKAYKQVLDFVKDGCIQQAGRADADAKYLADVASEIGALGELQTAVQIRDAALTKLPQSSREVFIANCKGLPETIKEAAKPEEKKQASSDDKPSFTKNIQQERGRLDTDP